MPAFRDSYKGHPTLTLKRDADDSKGFTFGLAKAALILANIGAIESFVRDETPAEDKKAA